MILSQGEQEIEHISKLTVCYPASVAGCGYCMHLCVCACKCAYAAQGLICYILFKYPPHYCFYLSNSSNLPECLCSGIYILPGLDVCLLLQVRIGALQIILGAAHCSTHLHERKKKAQCTEYWSFGKPLLHS